MNEFITKVSDLAKSGFDAFMGDGIKYIGAAVVGAGIAWLKKYKSPSLKLFGLSGSGNWSVYFGNTRTGTNGISAFDTQNANYVYGDMEATLRVVETMAELIGKSPTYHRALTNHKSINGSIISIGGPKWNKATEYLIGKLGSPVYYKEGTKALFIEKKSANNPEKFEFNETLVGKTRQIRDYGVIIVGKKGYFESFGDSGIESACVLMGYSTVGVRVAAEYLRKLTYPSKTEVKKLLECRLPKKINRFCLVVIADIQLTPDGDYVDHTEVDVMVIPESEFLNPQTYSYS